MTKQEFIQKAENLHGIGHYDYSEVPEKVLSNSYINVKCNIHNITFKVYVNTFLTSKNCECPECKIEKNTEIFIQKARRIHGDNKYDYSKVRYVSSSQKVIIICPIHGEFEQTPNSHLVGKGCPICGGHFQYTTETFIEAARKIHGDFYDYSLVDYEKSNIKVKIICPIHGVFEQTPFSHLQGYGCIKCSGKEKLTNESFKEKANKVHNFKYNYDLVDYENNQTKVKIICPIHGVFEQTPNSHLAGHGCELCSNHNNTESKETFIDRANKIHNFKYNYDLVDYKNKNTKVKIICPIHGIFEQTPGSHLSGSGCPHCAGHVRKTTEQFIDEANIVHDFKYDYSKVEYENEMTKVIIICPEHGEFLQSPKSHLKGRGCPQCYDLHNSKLEQHIEQFLKDNKIDFIRQQKFDWLKDKGYLKLDFYLPKYNIAIECQGSQHFHKHCIWGNKLDDVQRRDDIKYNQCKEHGIDILYFAFKNYDKEYRLGKIYTNLKKLLKKILEYDTTNGTQQ